LTEVPADVLGELQINPVETMDEVLQIALERLPVPSPEVGLQVNLPVWQQPKPVPGVTESSING